MFFKNKKIFIFEDIFSWVGFSLLCFSSRSPISAGFLILVASAYNRPTFHLCIMYIVHCVITCDIVYSSFYVVQCTGLHTSGLFCTCNLYLVYNRIWCDIMVYIVVCCVCNHNCSCILLALCTLAYWILCLGFWTTWHFVNIASKLYIVHPPQSWLHSMHTTVLYQHSSARIWLETIYKSSSYNDKDKKWHFKETLFRTFVSPLLLHIKIQ